MSTFSNFNDSKRSSRHGSRIIDREKLPKELKLLLVNSGLVNSKLDSKKDYFFGPYQSKYGDREQTQTTVIDKLLLSKIMKAANDQRGYGTVKKERWIAVLDFIAKVNRVDFKYFVSRIEPSIFPYLRALIEKACISGISGGHQITKLPTIHNTHERCLSMEPMKEPSDNQDFGEEILNVNNFKIMQNVADQTSDPLVAPIVYVLRHTKDFIFDDVTTSAPSKEEEKEGQNASFKDYKLFLKKVSLGQYTKSKEMLKEVARRDQIRMEKIKRAQASMARRPHTKFSDQTLSSAARGCNSNRGSMTRLKRSSRFGSMPRSNTQKYNSSKTMTNWMKNQKSNQKPRKSTYKNANNDDSKSDGSVSSTE